MQIDFKKICFLVRLNFITILPYKIIKMLFCSSQVLKSESEQQNLGAGSEFSATLAICRLAQNGSAVWLVTLSIPGTSQYTTVRRKDKLCIFSTSFADPDPVGSGTVSRIRNIPARMKER